MNSRLNRDINLNGNRRLFPEGLCILSDCIVIHTMDEANTNTAKPPSPLKNPMSSNSAPMNIPTFVSPVLPDRTMSSASSSSGGGNSQPCPMECDDSASSTNDSACNMNSANNLSELDDTEIEDEDEKRDEVGNMPVCVLVLRSNYQLF